MSWYRQHRYFYLALDPIHVGAGGYRLGRVDNSIVREPGANVPKIPGTSLSGAARSYAAMACGRIDAAGTQKGLKSENKNFRECPILYTFGTASDDVAPDPAQGKGSKAGAVSLSDARILLFPVSTTDGPMWVSSSETLREAGFKLKGTLPSDDKAVVSGKSEKKPINAGWLLLDVDGGFEFESVPASLANSELWKEVKSRILLVAPKFFSVLVNSNLEVRTSVSIDPETGAAAEHLLFTYEAIPRATWLFGEVVVDDYDKRFPDEQKWNKEGRIKAGEWKQSDDVVKTGLSLIEYLGVGGMGTRGFGRMKTVATEKLVG